MNYDDKINEIKKEINSSNLESAKLKLENLLKEVKETNVEDENNTYYTFSNYAEQSIFYTLFKSNKKNTYPEYNISEIYYLLGFINIDLKKYDEAIDYFDNSLKWNPINILAMFEKGIAYRLSGNIERFKAEVEKTYNYIYNSNYMSRFYRELGFYFVERKLYDLGNALYTYSNYFYKTDTAENELKYIAQQENRNVMYTPINEIRQYLRDYNIPLNFNKVITDCIFNELQNAKGRQIARYFSNLMYEMTLNKDFIWLEPIINENYGIQIDKPDHWELLSKSYYEKYGLSENTVFAFLAPQIGLYTVVYMGECSDNEFIKKFDDIIANLKSSGIKILTQYLDTIGKTIGKLCFERTENGTNILQNENYILENNRIFRICWKSQNVNPKLVNDELASSIVKSLITVNETISNETLYENKENNDIDMQIQLINDEFNKDGLSERTYNLINDFSSRNLKDSGHDPFWKDYAKIILNAIIVLILVDKNKISIAEVKEKCKNINLLREYCEHSVNEIDIVKVQKFPELINGITQIRKNGADKTISSALEIITESF